jgi:MerR family redox-sensitive transcriptional activator SoxR
VAERAGIATSAIRYYEAEGLLPEPARFNGRRVYDEHVLGRLRLIEVAKAGGFTMAEIKRLVSGFGRKTPPGVRWRALAEAKQSELAARIEEAQQMLRVLNAVTSCECPTFEECIAALDRP